MSKKPRGRPYTVVGVYHTFIGEGCHGNTWMHWVRAADPKEAVWKAKEKVREEHDQYLHTELGTVAVFLGHRRDLFDCPVDE